MSNLVWHSGPPPSLGWWPASANKDPDVLRWRSATSWSRCVTKHTPLARAAYLATQPAYAENIRWTERPASWPERSRT